MRPSRHGHRTANASSAPARPPGSLRAGERAWQAFRSQFRPVGVEVSNLERDHLIALPLRYVDVLEDEVRVAKSQTRQAVMFPLLRETQLSEESKSSVEIGSRRHEWI